MQMQIGVADKLLRFESVTSVVGLKRTALYALIADGRFPRPVKIGKASRWSEQAVQQWIRDRVAGSVA